MNPKIKADLLRGHGERPIKWEDLPNSPELFRPAARTEYQPSDSVIQSLVNQQICSDITDQVAEAFGGLSKDQAAEALIGILQANPISPWGKMCKVIPASNDREGLLLAAQGIWNEIADRWSMGLTNDQVEYKFQEMQRETYGQVFLKVELLGSEVHFKQLIEGEWRVLS